ncbi:MAG TPA: TlpA disulfide reductase family protein, partial [Prevotella sp.]|nr:TlpA disulfide reductase family protein [Prevotella sp.]
SPMFKGVDVNGKEMTLRDFRGKYIYIDMWATWCGPCQKELPFLKKLEEKFKGRNIVFVGLSIDQDKAKWAARVKSGALSGTQLYIGKGSKFQSDYRISGIPRFILLDPNGRIVNPDMTRPSSEDTEKILNSQPGL